MGRLLRQAILLGALMLVSAGAGVWLYQYNQSDFETLQGTQYRWNSLRGDWVIINYFAPWCAPCLREMPELHVLNERLPSHVHLFAINYDRLSIDDLSAMTRKFDITLEVIVATEETRLPIEKPPYLPATYIIGPHGQLQARIVGEVTAEMLMARLHQLQAL